MRKVTESDKDLIAEGISFDEDHKAKGMVPEFFFEPKTESYVFEDEYGPVFVTRISRVLRLDIQFLHVDKDRIMDTLKKHFPAFKAQAASAGFKQLVFDSVSRGLIAFCKRRLGFKPSPNEFVAEI